MKKDFMWYFTFIWLTLGSLSMLWEVLVYADSDSFWGLAFSVPTLIWLWNKSK